MTSSTTSQNAALMVKWGELWEGDISIADDLVTDDFVTHVAPLRWASEVETSSGRDELKHWISGGVRLMLPDMHFSVDVGPIADDNYMVVRWRLDGTYNGDVPGSPPDAVGRKVSFTGTDIVRIEGGKFAEYWLNADTLDFMHQIGLV